MQLGSRVSSEPSISFIRRIWSLVSCHPAARVVSGAAAQSRAIGECLATAMDISWRDVLIVATMGQRGRRLALRQLASVTSNIHSRNKGTGP